MATSETDSCSIVKISWDDEAKVWYVSDTSIQGLVLESGSLDVLIERIRLLATEIHPELSGSGTQIRFLCERIADVAG